VFVETPIVRMAYLSTYLANFRDYELSESSVALDTATIMQFGFFVISFNHFQRLDIYMSWLKNLYLWIVNRQLQ